eukprot:8630295-Prorocentrum_lima.AAC.1
MHDGVSRHARRLRGIALQGMVEVIARQRMGRVLNSKTKKAVQLEEYHAGDIMEFYRALANKD